MSEMDLVTKVQDALEFIGIGGKVVVAATGIPGVVRLSGPVFSEEDRLRADEVARGIDEVMDVIDDISISHPPHRPGVESAVE